MREGPALVCDWADQLPTLQHHKIPEGYLGRNGSVFVAKGTCTEKAFGPQLQTPKNSTDAFCRGSRYGVSKGTGTGTGTDKYRDS